MAGYLADYSMSVNASLAYDSGEKPYSKWNKQSILEMVDESYPEKYDLLKNVKLEILKEKLLYKSSWHHTSKFYNCTDFYSVDEDILEELTSETVEEWKRDYAEKKPSKIVRKNGDIYFWEWEKISRKKFTKRYYSHYDVFIEEHGKMYYVYDKNNKLIVRKKSNPGKVAVVYNESKNNKVIRKLTIYDEKYKAHEYSINYKEIYKNMTEMATAFFKSINKNYDIDKEGYLYRKGYFSYDWSPENGTMRLKPIIKNKSVISFELEFYYAKCFVPEKKYLEDKTGCLNIYGLNVA